ncbi:MAG: hypothetical protein KH321_03290 [Clostridium sp.]|jgi:hypothetical protein|nr:hypothetical protein [Clostridium sp.]
MSIGTSLIQATNLVLLLRNANTDTRKFVVWQKSGNELVEVLQGLEITRIPLEDQAKLFEHPIETGVVITDGAIFDPKRATIQAYIANDDNTTLEELYQLYLSGAELAVRAGNKIIDKVAIASAPFEITSDILDKTPYTIALREFFEVSSTYTNLPPKKVAKKSNASRVNSGVKQAKPVKKSWLKSAVSGGRS